MENWTNNMKHFLIITNAFKDKNLKLTNEIKGYIEKKGGSCQCFTSTGDDAKHAAPEADAIAQETECVLVLGGDGTLIRAASKLVEIWRSSESILEHSDIFANWRSQMFLQQWMN